MTADSGNSVVAICCAVFQAEVEVLRREYWPDLDIRYQSSMLHMRPGKLAVRLEALIDEELRRGNRILLIYGDCCMRMTELTERPGVVRTRGNNCCDLLLGSADYRRLSHDGAFFLFPEWTRRWRHIFSVELGLNQSNAAGLMNDMHRKLLYLDTGVIEIPKDDLEECSRYCELPWESLKVSLEPLRAAIQAALEQLENMRKSA
jgi:hypothetical protein